MHQVITLRLDKNLEDQLKLVAEQQGLSKSEVVRESLTEYLAKKPKPSAWELGKELFGNQASGQSNLAEDRKKIFKDKTSKK